MVFDKLHFVLFFTSFVTFSHTLFAASLDLNKQALGGNICASLKKVSIEEDGYLTWHFGFSQYLSENYCQNERRPKKINFVKTFPKSNAIRGVRNLTNQRRNCCRL